MQLGEQHVLKKDWKFQYTTDPEEVTWKKGAIFKIVGFSKLVDDHHYIEFEDEQGRIIGVTDDLIPYMFEERQQMFL